MLHAISATIIRNNIYQNTEPCDDFYQFACGGYLDLTVKPDYTANSTALTFSDYIFQLQMSQKYEDKLANIKRGILGLRKIFTIAA